MTKLQVREFILSEIDKLNDRIDRLILRGKPYRKEAEQHAALVAKL